MTFQLQYILDGQTPRPEFDLFTWGKWMQTADRKVRQEEVGDIWISTVFLGLDHQYGQGPPLLFETWVRHKNNDNDEFCRYSTWQEAEAGHKQIVERIRNL